MWMVIVGAALLLLLVWAALRGRPQESVASPARGAAKRVGVGAETVPRLVPRDDAVDEITVARYLLPKIAHADPESVRMPAAEELPELHETDDEGTDTDVSGMHRLILVTAVAHTDPGLHRKENEDSFLALDDYAVFVVADGMGGHAGGEIASALAVQVVSEAFHNQLFPGARRVTRWRRANELVRAVELANDAVRRTAAEDRDLHDMGTTLVAARFSPGKQRVYIANVGDSRMYRVRDGAIQLLTTDHTLAVEMGAKGKLGAQLTRAVGVTRSVRPDVRVEDAFPGDCYVLCSDGLTKMLSDEEIRAHVCVDDLEAAAKSLVATANEHGGRDNITVILIRIDDARGS